MTEAALTFAAGLLGLGALAGVRHSLPAALVGWAAIPVGAGVWATVALLTLVARLPLSPLLVTLLTTLLCSAVAFRARRHPPSGSARELSALLGPTVGVAALAGVVSAVNATALTVDSYWLLVQARALSDAGVAAPPDLIVLRSFPVMVSILQSLSGVAGQDYLAAQPFAVAAPGMGILAAMLWWALDRAGVPRARQVVVTALATLAVGSTYMVAFQLFYVKGSLEAGVYVLMCCAGMWAGVTSGDDEWWTFAGLAVVPALLLRVESVVFLLPIAVVAATHRGVRRSVRLRVVGPFVALVVLWYGTVLLPLGEGTLLDDGRNLAVVVLALLLLPLVWLTEGTGLLARAAHAAPWLMVASLGAVSVLFTLAEPSYMRTAFDNIAMNTFVPRIGLWGWLWTVIVLGLVLGSTVSSRASRRFLIAPLVSYFLVLYATSYFAGIPHELGWASSANRMLSVMALLGAFTAVLLPVAGGTRDEEAVGAVEGDREAVRPEPSGAVSR